MSKSIEIKDGTATLTDIHGDVHTFENGKEILSFTENVGMFGLHEMFSESQISFLMHNGRTT